MSVKEQLGYAIVCDFPDCGVTTGDLGEYAFWGDHGDAADEWESHDGYAGDLGDYCRVHTVWSDVEGVEGIDERSPMPFTLENLWALAERRIAARIEKAEYRALKNLGDRIRAQAARDSQRQVNANARLRTAGVLA